MTTSGEAERSTTTVMVASLFDRPGVGDAFDKVPLHLTYLPWFQLPDNERDGFDFHVQEIVEQNRAPRILGGALRLFTDDKTGELITVRQIDKMTSGFNYIQDFSTHSQLHSFARTVDTAVDLNYFGHQWNPHVTSVNGQEMQQGEEVQLDNLTLLAKQFGKKVVQEVYAWK